MNINNIGATAFFIAGFRASEADREQPFFSDPYAEWFIDDEMRARIADAGQQIQSSGISPRTTITYRTLAFDGMVADAIRRDVRQIVILGSGFDMRPYRFATEGVAFFEVDQPEVIDFKQQVMRNHGLAPCPAARCNYLEVDLPQELAAIGLDLEQETMFLWEGNTYYLPEGEAIRFLNLMCERIPRFRIAFDYMWREMRDADTAQTWVQIAGIDGMNGFEGTEEFERETPMRDVFSASVGEFALRHVDPKLRLALADMISAEQFSLVYRMALLAHG